MIILAGIEVGERLPIGVDDLEATGQALNGPWKRRLAIGSKPREKGADRSRRPLDNERPTTTYLSVAALPPAVTGSPRGTGEVPRCAGGASPCAQCSWSASFFQTKLKKRQALSQKRAEASCVVGGAGDQKMGACCPIRSLVGSW